MKNLLVTCVFNNLYETKLGGRPGRSIQYTKSLSTITKMEQDIVVYTTEEDKKLLLSDERIKNYNKIRFVIYDLYKDKNHEYFQNKKDELGLINMDRCFEIMHNKVIWMNNHTDEGYDNIYWIDAGLSYGALFPSKFRGGIEYEKYFENTLFTPKVFENLNKINDKIFIIGGNQTYHTFESSYSSLFQVPIKFNERYHIIGGFFGGNNNLIKELFLRYKNVLEKMIFLGVLNMEEHLLTLLFNMDDSLFEIFEFTTWHHEESQLAIYNKDNEIYFYKIFENLNL
jgi:hypothetical protein